MEQEWFSVEELSRILNLHRKTVQRFIRDGQIKGTKFGRNWMVHRDELRSYTHAELAKPSVPVPPEVSGGMTVIATTTIEVQGMGYAEAARISSNIMGALASPEEGRGICTFTFGYAETSRRATFALGGSLDFLARAIALFAIIQNNATDGEAEAQEIV
jgi:excisionase family DNA binding protein